MRPDADYTYDFGTTSEDDEMYAENPLDGPDSELLDDSVKCCPDCERPNQFGELCPACEREMQEQAS